MTFWDVAPWIYALVAATTLSGLLYVWDTTPFAGRPVLTRFVPLVFGASIFWPLTWMIIAAGALFFWWRDWERMKRARPKE